MANPRLGRQLTEAGWEQGSLLPALSWSVDFHQDDPVTNIAKAALKRQDGGRRWNVSDDIPEISPHAVASGMYRGDHRLVVISQTCDIDKSPDYEPCVAAARAFFTENEPTLQAASRNSARYFLLDPGRRLVVDITVQTLIEKPLLATLNPAVGAPDAIMRRRFARWLARRYNRLALPDDIVIAVNEPILRNLRVMQENNDPALDVLDDVEDVRIIPPTGKPPYEVDLIFIVPEQGLKTDDQALAHLVGLISSWFDPVLARLQSWAALHLYEISAGDYLDSEPLDLGEYTYRGQTIRGLQPRQFG